MPILEYDHSVGCSITDGYRYRGNKNKDLEGIYFYGDFCTGRIWGATEDGMGNWTTSELLDTDFLISAFGEDENGEIYFAHWASGSGAVYQIVGENSEPTQLCNGKTATIVGTERHDVISGTNGPDVIHGLGGNDVIQGLGGNDVICGGNGHEVIGSGSGNDIVFGENGHDAIWGGRGKNVLQGGDGNDSIFGGPDNDEVLGNFGNDSLYGLAGVDVIRGGWGPNNGSIDNNDACYDTAGTIDGGCEVYYEQ